MAIHEILLPRTSDAMTEAIVSRVFAPSNSIVEKDSLLMDIETDKATVEVNAIEKGLFLAIATEEGTFEVGSILGYILTEGDIEDFQKGLMSLPGYLVSENLTSKPSTSEPIPSLNEVDSLKPPAKSGDELGANTNGRQFSSPLARTMARNGGLSIEQITGTGPNGRVVRDDIRRELEGKGSQKLIPENLDVHKIDLSSRERSMAIAMKASKTEIPHFYISRSIHVSKLMDLRSEQKSLRGSAPSVTAFLVKAVAKAISELEFCQRRWSSDGVYLDKKFGVGIAVADGNTEIVVPVIHGAQSKSLSAISFEIENLANSVRDRTIKQHHLEGAVMTISNLGMYGIDQLFGIIPPGQSGIIGVGRAINSLELADDGSIFRCPEIKISLAGDHRVMSGVGGSELLAKVDLFIQSPEDLLEV